MIRFYIFFGFLLIPILAFGQPENIQFRHYTTADGLSQSWIRSIYQDETGYIWFGTDDGLNRFDGIEFKIYRAWHDNKKSLGNVSIRKIAYKNPDELWIGTYQGVYIYSKDLDSFRPFQFLKNASITALLVDNKGNTWFGTNNGLYLYNQTDSTLTAFRNYSEIKSGLSNSNVRQIFQDSHGNIWIGTQIGINIYIPESQTFRHYLITKTYHTSSDDVHAIVEDKNGRIWVGCSQGGVYLFKNALSQPEEGMFIELVKGSVAEMLVDSKNQLWVCNGSNLGLYVIDLNRFSLNSTPPIKYLKAEPLTEGSLSENTIMSIFEDKSGDIWLGTYGGGINYYSPRAKKFIVNRKIPNSINSISNNLVNTFYADDKNLWIGTESGLDRLNISTGKYDHYFNSGRATDLSGSAIYSIYQDSRGNLWYGSWAGGLNRYMPASNTFKKYRPDGSPGAINNANVFSILEDSKGNLWIGTIGGGLNLFNYRTETFKAFTHNSDDPQSIYHDAVNDILESADGKLYLSVYHSLDVYDYSEGSFKHFVNNPEDTTSIIPGQINVIFEDSRKNLWIGTNMGLELLLRPGGQFRHYTTKNGLPNNTIQAILEDDYGNLWISTNNGISKFLRAAYLPQNPVFLNYTENDGLSSNEFIARSAFKDSKGKFFFGSTKGYTCFHPDSIFGNIVRPKIVITEISIQKGQKSSQDKELLRKVNNEIPIHLKYYQSDFTIKYAALNFLNPSKNQYEYRLVGYEDEWNKVGSQRFANYTSIDPGKYTFLVKGSNNDGIWCKEPARLEIIIAPPWWNTLIFRIALVFFISFLIYCLYRIRIKILEDQKRTLESRVRERTNELAEVNILLEERQEEISLQNDELSKHRLNLERLINERTSELEAAKLKAEESDRLKSAFLANMSHEIRTPMNAIVGFSSLLGDDTITDEERDKFTQVIRSNSDILLVLINDIIDISLIEADQLVLNKSFFSVETILIEIEEYFRLRNDKPIKFSLNENNRDQRLILYNDQIRFRQILTNLLSNAFKYTSSGSIQFGFELLGERVKFFVKDTGLGISEKDQNSVFDYFRKIDHSDGKYYQGAGIGLTICKKLVEQMGGSIGLESTIGKGSTFYFFLPVTIAEKLKISDKSVKKIFQNLKDITVVVAEDEDTNYDLILTILKSTGAKVVRALNGKELIDYFAKPNNFAFHVILMDIKMPVMDGITACHEIKKISTSIPVIALTAYARPEDRINLFEQGFDDYLSKPFDRTELQNLILKWAHS